MDFSKFGIEKKYLKQIKIITQQCSITANGAVALKFKIIFITIMHVKVSLFNCKNINKFIVQVNFMWTYSSNMDKEFYYSDIQSMTEHIPVDPSVQKSCSLEYNPLNIKMRNWK